jgi:hypothetical protein
MFVCIGARRIIYNTALFLPDKFLFGDFSMDIIGDLLDPNVVDPDWDVKDQYGEDFKFPDFATNQEFDFF